MENKMHLYEVVFIRTIPSIYYIANNINEVWKALTFEREVLEVELIKRHGVLTAILAQSPPVQTNDWQDVNVSLPEEGEWVLHTNAGVRSPEYGQFTTGHFWRESKAGGVHATHWLRVPLIAGY